MGRVVDGRAGICAAERVASWLTKLRAAFIGIEVVVTSGGWRRDQLLGTKRRPRGCVEAGACGCRSMRIVTLYRTRLQHGSIGAISVDGADLRDHERHFSCPKH